MFGSWINFWGVDLFPDIVCQRVTLVHYIASGNFSCHCATRKTLSLHTPDLCLFRETEEFDYDRK